QALVPAPKTLFNIATLEMDLDKNVEANRDFGAYLDAPDETCRLPSATCAEQARGFLDTVRKKLGHLVGQVEPNDAKLIIDGHASPVCEWLSAGEKHVIKVEAPSQSVTKEVVLNAGTVRVERFDLRTTAPEPSVSAAPPPSTPPPGPVVQPPKTSVPP